jgi:hypothetical protein
MDQREITEYSTLAGDIAFTEDDIAAHRNKFAPVDGRMLPRAGVKIRTGKCHCGADSGPYTTCAKHRERRTLHRILRIMEAEGEIERVTDGRGQKGGAVWRATEKAKAMAETSKSFRRSAPKIGRNAPCPCGSGRKYKACCIRQTGG